MTPEATGNAEVANHLDFDLLAETRQTTLPVAQTLDHFLGHVGHPAFAQLLRQHTRRLLRMKALDDSRFQGDFIVAVDGTGYLSFSHHHCDQCLTQQHSAGTISHLHPVLEAKLLTATGLAVSLASEFIENPPGRTPADYQGQKQDCELKAFDRLAATLKAAFPQLRLCLNFDSFYGCGRVLALCRQYGWHFVVTFKEGRICSSSCCTTTACIRPWPKNMATRASGPSGARSKKFPNAYWKRSVTICCRRRLSTGRPPPDVIST
jgi:hypothetical protein